MTEEKLHLDRVISIGNIGTLITTLFLVAGSYYGVQSRMAILENQMTEVNRRIVDVLEAQTGRDALQDADLTRFRSEMREDSKNIEAKLDRLLEAVLRDTARRVTQ